MTLQKQNFWKLQNLPTTYGQISHQQQVELFSGPGWSETEHVNEYNGVGKTKATFWSSHTTSLHGCTCCAAEEQPSLNPSARS